MARCSLNDDETGAMVDGKVKGYVGIYYPPKALAKDPPLNLASRTAFNVTFCI